MGDEDSGMVQQAKPKPFRNKKWSEMTAEEHVEKLKLELLRTQEQLSSLCQYVTKLMEHDHMDHRMVVRLKNPNEESYGGACFRVSEKLQG